MIVVPPDKPPSTGVKISSQGRGWCSVPSCPAIFCHKCSTIALHLTPGPLPLSRSRAVGLLQGTHEHVALLPICDARPRLAFTERSAISGKTNLAANCSGYLRGHLGVCIVCGNCFISAGKENTYYHAFATDRGFCVGHLSRRRKRRQLMAHPAAVPTTACSYPTPQGGGPTEHCVQHVSSQGG